MKFLAAAFASCALVIAPPASAHDVVESQLIETGPGQVALMQTLVVDVSPADAWRWFTEAELVKKWMAPAALVDLRDSGAIYTSYDGCADIENGASGEGVITLSIERQVPGQLLILRSSLDGQRDAAWMSDAIWQARDGLANLITFADAGRGRTRITSYGLGYGSGEGWEAMTGFFIAGNEWTFQNLQKAISGEPAFDPDCSAD